MARRTGRGTRVVRTTRGSLRGKRTPELLAMPVRHEWYTVLAINAAKLTGRLLVLAARHRLIVAGAAALIASVVTLGRLVTGLLLIAVAVVGAVWRWRWPQSFERVVACPVRSRWRRWWIYERHWQPAMVTCGLAATYGDAEYLPRVRRVVSSPVLDVVTVDLLACQGPTMWEKVTEQLAHTFAALRVTVRVDRPGRIWVECYHGDPLAELVQALPVPAVPDFDALPIGITEQLAPWTLRIRGRHLLVVGASDSGKASIVWGVLRSMGEGIRTGLVKVWGVDPKRLELPMCPAIFDRIAYRSLADMCALLEDGVAEMELRADRKSGVTRDHTPSVHEPLLVIVVQELAALVAYGDRETKRRTKAALQLLLSQGRAVGVVVIAEAQDASKDVIEFRDLFHVRICLRVNDAEQVDMALGDGARARGAECDRIPDYLPGVGYVQLEGVREPMRVRAGYITDADLTEMGNHYAPSAPALDRAPRVVARGLFGRPGPEAA